MEQSLENKPALKNRLIDLYYSNKVIIYIFILILISVSISFFYIKYNNEKKNIVIAEKYIQAGLYLSKGKIDNAKVLYKEIINSKNRFYSILSLNTVIEKKLFSDKEQILKYFESLEKSTSTNSQKDLIIIKKALYLINYSDLKKGKNLLKTLVDKNSALKPLAQELLDN